MQPSTRRAPFCRGVQERALAAALLRADADVDSPARTTATALVGLLTAVAEQEPRAGRHGRRAVARPRVRAGARVRGTPAAAAAQPAPRAPVAGRGELPLGLARALPDERVERVAPGPLSLAALHQRRELADRRVFARGRCSRRLAEASGGNPFFALEIARALASRPAATTTPGEPLPVPRSLEELVAAHVGGLSDRGAAGCAGGGGRLAPDRRGPRGCAPGERDVARGARSRPRKPACWSIERERIRFTHPLLASVDLRLRVARAAPAAARAPRRRRRGPRAAGASPGAQHDGAGRGARGRAREAAAHAAARGARSDAAAELFAASVRLTPSSGREDHTRRTLGEASALLAGGDVERRARARRGGASTADGRASRGRAPRDGRDPLGRRDVQGGERADRERRSRRRPAIRRLAAARLPEARLLQRRAPPGAGRRARRRRR